VKPHTLHRTTIINRPIEEVFRFFCDPANLNLITPPSYAMKIISRQPIELKKGALIDYRIKVSGIPLRWRTEITEWKPPYYFVDIQLKGPYRLWMHEHRFEAQGNNTVMHDDVQFLSPGWFLEPLVNKWFVEPKIISLFDHRTQCLKKIFNGGE
jgi:ligand-binding SRPBCC domain-containing protein